MKNLMSLILLSFMATTAMAQVPYESPAGYSAVGAPYVGVAAGSLFYQEDGLPTLSPTIVEFRVGQQFSPYIGIEGRLGTSVSGGWSEGAHVNGQLLYAGYVKGSLPVSPWVSIYALGGLGGAQIHRNFGAGNGNDVALSYGIGSELAVGGGAALTLEFTRLTTGNDLGVPYTADQLTFGVNWRL